MLWLIVPVIVIAVVFIAGHRKTALGLLVVAIIAGGLIYRYDLHLEQQATTRISAAEIGLENIAVRRTFDASYELTGRIRNNSETYRIDGIGFTVKMRDCPGTDAAQCVVTGVATANVTVTVPPREARDFTGALYYGKGHKPPKGTLAWDYEITAITAQRQ